jgi:hypothetical protein
MNEVVSNPAQILESNNGWSCDWQTNQLLFDDERHRGLRQKLHLMR